MSLTARHIEEQGIPTVVMGCAKDLVETCGVPRFVFSDFPLGNSCGKPSDEESQTTILGMALDLYASAKGPRTTVQTPYRWADSDVWKRDFWEVEQNAEKRAATQRAFEQTKATQKEKVGTIGA